jgi:hypothetical protein
MALSELTVLLGSSGQHRLEPGMRISQGRRGVFLTRSKGGPSELLNERL